ncbi:PAS domain S-box protein [Catalinimonas niigatensis]|uniref:PAS domain S-box protein n=1 Tax=Catalinimonas niigatensis TaxID=1397264 RepID=UPI002665BC34|nr:PAS domain S-box protein [Catalinimonas niigatensis]WPP50959.1 PAS domain S-box protein [Catalinimonas niigatensis]
MQILLLHKLCNKLPGLYWLVDRNFNCVGISNAYLEWLGETETALIQKNIIAYVQDKKYANKLGGVNMLRSKLERVRESGKEEKYQINNISSETDQHEAANYELSYIPIPDDNGQVEYILHQAKELTRAPINYSSVKHYYKDLLESSAQMIWTTNADGLVEENSPSWCAFTGQSYEEYKASGWLNVVHPDDKEKVLTLWRKSIESGTPFKVTYRVHHLTSGRWSWTIARAIALHNIDNSVDKWLGMNIILSDRRQSEEMAEEVNLYRNLASHLPFGAAFILDQNLRYILADGLALKQLGLKSSDLEGKTIWEALGDKLANEFAPYYRKALTGQSFMHEHSNHGHYYVSHGTPLPEDHEKTKAVLVVSYDITERKKFEEELKRRKEEFKAHFQQKIVGNLQADAKTGNILLVNQKLCDITGYDEHELLERTLWELTDPQDMEETKKLFVELVNGVRSSFDIEKQITHKNGQIRWISMSVNVDQYEHNGRVLQTGAVILDITKRKCAEEAQQKILSELEKRAKEFDTVLSTVEDGIFIVDREKRFLYCNQKNLNFLGKRKVEDVVGKKMPDIGAAPEVVEVVHNSFETVCKSKRSSAHTTSYTTSTGKTIYLEYILVPILSSDGEVESIVGSTRDISKRKMSEESVRRSEKELAAIFSKAAVGLSEISLEGKILKVNDQICHILGRSREELLKMGMSDITHPEDISHSFSAFEKLLMTNEPVSIDKRYVKPDGSIVWANSSITRLDDEQGHPRSVLAVSVDLTERTKAEQALRKSEQHLEYEVMSLNELHKMTMEVLETQSIQEALDKMLNTTITLLEAEFGFIQLFKPEKRSLELVAHYGFDRDFLKKLESVKIQHNTSFNRALRSGRRCVIEDVERDESYQEFVQVALDAGYHSAQSTPLISRNGEVIGVLSTYYRKSGKLSDRSKKLLDLLARQIADLIDNRETEEALRNAKEKAEIAARAKEDFLAHMSHEIRTPLNAVLGLSNLMIRQNKQAEMLENLQTLKFSAENLKMLVNDILDFSKIQAGKVSVDESSIRLTELMNSLYNAHQLQASEKNNVLKFALDQSIPEVICTDQLKLSQVMHNLLSNAIKFTENGSVNVEVKLKKVKKDKVWIHFSVSDTGIGIAQDKLLTIFDAFTQADNSTVKQYGGTGLGLSITKLLLEMMGSNIEVKSKKGEGSCFFFTLAVKKGDAAKVPAKEEIQLVEEDAQFPEIEILLTEDEAINRMVVNQFLNEWWQIKPDEAVDGKEALEMAQAKQYDIILMDVRMPNMDGYQATRLIRDLEEKHYKQVPIIALTADTPQEVQKHPLAHLFTDIVTKPFDPDDLQKKILEYLPMKKNKARQAAGQALPLNIDEVQKIFQDDMEMTRQFYNKAIQSFAKFQEEYDKAMSLKDKGVLSNSSHKMAMVMKILSLDQLKKWLDHSKLLLESDAPYEQLESAKKEGKKMIEQIIHSLEEQNHGSEIN